MHNGKMVAIGPVSKILEMHGQGFSIEVQANMSQLASQEPIPLSFESDFIESHSQARNILERTQSRMEEDTVMVACQDFVKEYHA
mmetsp:Transcript_24466/g.30478  ORF Transcript_24466/g.30478 Transcript_24466/m.30478 type:complete len:85 (+) Transcript_24466:4931-5185(+)